MKRISILLFIVFSFLRVDTLNTQGQQIKRAATLVMLYPPTPARKSTAWSHAPSQPLMRSLLSQSQTPAASREGCRFFRVWLSGELPRRADHPA